MNRLASSDGVMPRCVETEACIKKEVRKTSNGGLKYRAKGQHITMHTHVYLAKRKSKLSKVTRQEKHRNKSLGSLSSNFVCGKWVVLLGVGILFGLFLSTKAYSTIFAQFRSQNNQHGKLFDDASSWSINWGIYLPSALTSIAQDVLSSSSTTFIIDSLLESQAIGVSQAKKPRLVIHIGPHKTATTSLQSDLTVFQDYLRKDNFVYIGRQYKPYENRMTGKFILNRRPDSPVLIALRHMFSSRNKLCQNSKDKTDCCADFLQILRDTYYFPYELESFASNSTKKRNDPDRRKLRPRGKFNQPPPNLLISDEALLRIWNIADSNTTAAMWKAMHETLTETWDVLIVSTYRRFYEWLPSAKAQKDKPTLEPWRAEWPREDGNGGIPLQPLFPDISDSDAPNLSDIFAEWQGHHFLSDSVLNTIKSLQNLDTTKKFQLKIFHTYGKQRHRTNFLCKVLSIKFSCRESRKRDKTERTETRLNAQKFSPLKLVISSWNQQNNDPVELEPPLAYYDVIATAAAEQRLIDTSVWRRQQVAEQLQKFDRDMHQKATELNMNHLNLALPLKCPTKQQLMKLLTLSMRIEAEYIPKLYIKGHVDHQMSFQSKVASKFPYCWVDTDSILTVSNDENDNDVSSLWREYILRSFS